MKNKDEESVESAVAVSFVRGRGGKIELGMIEKAS
jgi:hypothetical protein